MKDTVTPYQTTELGKKEQVALMFDKIAPKYDFLNHFLSLGIDKQWRRKAIRLVATENPDMILDIATGTGDLAIEASKLNPKKIYGVDISKDMLAIGQQKIKKLGLSDQIELAAGDAENLDFADNMFDVIIVAFGVRNFEHLNKGLKEMNRVLKPGGKLMVLEFSKPTAFPLKQLYHFYFNSILPGFGKLISKDNRAYSYLPESVRQFPDGKLFEKELKIANYKPLLTRRLTLGICSIYWAEKH